MSPAQTIVCKPTPWFLLRAFVMLLMFGVFAVLFYIDGSTGYRKKNEAYFLHKTFQKADADFAKMDVPNGSLKPEEWKSHAAAQTVEFPEDRSILPLNLELPMKWPAILHDFEKMKPLQWNILWREYTKERGMDGKPAEKPFDAGKIREQWIVFWICLILSVIAAFFLLRTIRRSISADGEAITDQKGKRVPFPDLNRLDLRKWDTKGLAFIDYDGPSGKGRLRVDGLTYGGFKKENGEPAEMLMQHIRTHFSGEIIEYTQAAEVDSAAPPTTTD